MRALWAGLLLLVDLPSGGVASYEHETIVAIEEALTRLGYDIGPSDGTWGPKERGALNELRAKNGLPPADIFTGSSLALIHRLSPGATTLPHPGILITDPVARRAFSSSADNWNLGAEWCPDQVGDAGYLSTILARPPVAVVNTTAGAKGYINDQEDWFSSILLYSDGCTQLLCPGRGLEVQGDPHVHMGRGQRLEAWSEAQY